MLATLCTTQVTSWGVLYYAFPVLAGDITAATGWSTAAITAALSASQLVAALVGIPIGRHLDRHGPRAVMTAGSVLAVPAVVAVATAQNLAWFLAAWLAVGVAMGAVLYPPAFAALTRWHGPDPVRALTILTLAGGLASTVFAPLTAVLAAHLDWRATYLVLAGILAVVTIPAHWFGLRQPWPPRPEPGPVDTDPRQTARSGAFVTLAVALSLTALATFAAVINLVPLLAERGISTGVAAVALGLGGAGQVVGRLGYATIVRRTSVLARTVAILLAIAVTTALLGVLTTVVTLVAGAVVAGMARGVFTLLQATAVTDRWGRRYYGHLTGLLSAPMTITMALAPFAGAATADLLGSYSTTFLILGALAAVAAALANLTVPKLHKELS
ncbi:MAG: MFS transporter [Actinophytocola sp.]|uniref:MFS transporter n=1 Tax=Actinophytocola sp. TaxID=1872138 RepID=UPI0013248FC9|nr:MFS transporter [Actinophytocola sp.]MPZ79693.1 MFS transporter [Actinophytocola sp.]